MCADENPERSQERWSDKVLKPQIARCSCLILSISLSTNLLKVPCGERTTRINTEDMTPMQILAIFNLNCHITSKQFESLVKKKNVTALHWLDYLWDVDLRNIVLDQGLQSRTDQIHCSLTVVLKQSVRYVSCYADEIEKHEKYQNKI